MSLAQFAKDSARAQFEIENRVDEQRPEIIERVKFLYDNPSARVLDVWDFFIRDGINTDLVTGVDPQLVEMKWADIADLANEKLVTLSEQPFRFRSDLLADAMTIIMAAAQLQAQIESGQFHDAVKAGIENGEKHKDVAVGEPVSESGNLSSDVKKELETLKNG